MTEQTEQRERSEQAATWGREPVRRVARWAILFAALVVAVSGCGGREEEPPPEAPKPLPVKMFEVGAGSTQGTVEFPGRIQAWLHSEMAFEVSGKITEFNVVEGDRVSKGDVLVELDPRDFEADVLKAQANEAKAKADFERYSLLFKEGVESRASLDARVKRYEVTQAELAQAVKALEDAQLVAPFDGVIARKLVQDFENVRSKSPVLILQNVSRLKLRVAVPESDLASDDGVERTREQVDAKLDARVVVSSLPDLRFPATLGELSLTADPTTRTFDATFYFEPQPGVSVLPGMTAKIIVNFDASPPEAYTIPGVAVFSNDAGNPQVWRVDSASSSVEQVPVTVGRMSGSDIQIRGGIGGGDVIVVSGVHELTEGRIVRKFER